MKLDNMRVGRYVIVREVFASDITVTEVNGIPFVARANNYMVIPPVNGAPLEIVSISLPFIAVITPVGELCSIDTRLCELIPASRQYVRAFEDYLSEMESAQIAESAPQPSRLCPMCGSSLCEKRVGIGSWALHCNQCGFTGQVAR